MKNMGSTLILTILVGVHPHKMCSKSVQWFERRSRKTKKVNAVDTDDDNGHRVIARVTLAC